MHRLASSLACSRYTGRDGAAGENEEAAYASIVDGPSPPHAAVFLLDPANGDPQRRAHGRSRPNNSDTHDAPQAATYGHIASYWSTRAASHGRCGNTEQTTPLQPPRRWQQRRTDGCDDGGRRDLGRPRWPDALRRVTMLPRLGRCRGRFAGSRADTPPLRGSSWSVSSDGGSCAACPCGKPDRMAPGGDNRLLTSREAAAHLGIPYRKFMRSYKRWGIAVLRPDPAGACLFRVRTLDYWLDRNEKLP
jgi:hypothetical protein